MKQMIGLLLLLVCAAPAAAQERITDYHTTVTVGDDGTMTVAERIAVVAQGNKIKRGIYRDIPVRYAGGPLGTKVNAPIRITKIERNGKAEPYHTERNGDVLRIYVGDADVFVPRGPHTYLIEYTTKQLRHFDDHDEVYWNATGNAWAFPIDKARATVVLPAGVDRAKVTHEGYVGPLHSKNQKDLTSRVDDATGNVEYEATIALKAGEGLSIVATFPKGHVPEMSAMGRLLEDPIVFWGGLTLLIVGVLCGVTWVMFGRDPSKGTIIPEYDAPDGMAPAAVRYVDRMGYDNTCFAATLVSLGVKGHLRIEDDDDEYELHKENDDTEALPDGEGKVMWELFEYKDKIAMRQSNHKRFSAAVKKLKKWLSRDYGDELFTTNIGWTALAAAVAIGGIALSTVLAGGEGMLIVWLALWSVGTGALVSQVITNWANVFRGGGKTGVAITTSVFAVPFVIAEVVVIGLLAHQTSLWLIPITLALVGGLVVYARLIKQPTKLGRKVMDRIDGLRMYLSTAERDRLEAATKRGERSGGGDEPPRTVELFEKMLPYAIALGVENEWAAQFESILKAASTDPGSGDTRYRPHWYSGRGFDASRIGASVAAVGVAMSAAVASAATSPSSGSSGSSGGGFSGGGGGGGGGGGW